VPVVESAKVRLGQVCRQLAEAVSAKYWSGHFRVQLWLTGSANYTVEGKVMVMGGQEVWQVPDYESKN
jgi:hypothetical protein